MGIYLLYFLHKRAQTLLSLVPADDAEDIDSAPLVLTQHIGLAGAEATTAALLPLPFSGSPEVVAEFTVGGVDFSTGPTDIKLERRVLAIDTAVWCTYYWDEVRTVT